MIPTTDELVRRVDVAVAGMRDSKRWLCSLVRRHMLAAENQRDYRPPNVVLIGPTGGGKTWMVRHVLEAAAVPHIEVNCTQYTPAGIYGPDLPWMFHGFVDRYTSPERRPKEVIPWCERWGVVVLDEFDKWRFHGRTAMQPKTQSSALPDVRDSNRSIQAELLRITEGDEVVAKRRDGEAGYRLRTHNMLFIGMGAFEGIDDLIDPYHDMGETAYQHVEAHHLQQYGFMEELVGRFSTIVPLPYLDVTGMLRVLQERLWPQYLQQAEDDGLVVDYDVEALSSIAQVAVTRRVGARGLVPIIEALLRRPWSLAQPGDRIVVDAQGVVSGAARLQREEAA